MRTPCSGRSLLIVVLGIGALSGCSILEPEKVCTLLPCGHGLVVQLTSLPTEPHSGEVLMRGVPQPFSSYECNWDPRCLQESYECDGGPSCRQEIYFYRLTLPHISVRVTTSAGSLVTEFQNIVYRKTYPNGRSCDPCPIATVTAEVPAGLLDRG